MKRTLLFSTINLFTTSLCPLFSWQCCPEGQAAPTFFLVLAFMLCVHSETDPISLPWCLQSTQSSLSPQSFFCPFPGCVHLLWLRVTGFYCNSVQIPWNVQCSYKTSKCLSQWKNRQRTTRHDRCHTGKCYHLSSKELISGSVCVPCPFQRQAGSPLWLQKLSFIPSLFPVVIHWIQGQGCSLQLSWHGSDFQFRARLGFPFAHSVKKYS